jgi:hypothetical protein
VRDEQLTMAAKPKTAPPAAEPPRPKHVTSAYQGAQIQPTGAFHPHQPAQVTQTVGQNPDPPANRQAAPDISPTVPYLGDSPTGYDPYTMGTY